MLPGRNTAKYKYLTRIQIDIWNTLKTKRLKKKKWRPLIGRLKKQEKIPTLMAYQVRPLSKFPVYYRYFYKNTLYLKQGFKLFYGGLQDYRIKAIVWRAKKHGCSQLNFFREFDKKLYSFLYNLKITKSISEAKHHCKYQRVLVNGSSTQGEIKKGDVVHFNSKLLPIVIRRLRQKGLKYLPFEIDFDCQSVRFYLMHEKTIFWHPFLHKFKRVIRWYAL
jgi:hypothetical protein